MSGAVDNNHESRVAHNPKTRITYYVPEGRMLTQGGMRHSQTQLATGLPSGITALILTVRFEFVVIVDRKIPAVDIFEFLGVELGRVFTYWKSVNQGMQLAAP
jgi:hypothetical protein